MREHSSFRLIAAAIAAVRGHTRGKVGALAAPGPATLVAALCIFGFGTVRVVAAPTDAGPAEVSSDGLWHRTDESSIAPLAGERRIVPDRYRTLALDERVFKALVSRAPIEFGAARSAPVVMSLPMPDGGFARFVIEESPIMAPELAARFPEIKTFKGQGIDDQTATARFGWTSGGFHAIAFGTAGTVYVDRYSEADTVHYITYFKRDYRRMEGVPGFQCLVGDGEESTPPVSTAVPEAPLAPESSNGTLLRTYRLALAANGEYTQFHGGTKALAFNNGLVPAMNRVTGVYERELAIRMVMIANEMDIIFEQPLADPYVNEDGTSMLAANQVVLDGLIGSANYDIGHVFSTGGGGIAGLGVVCGANVKARGVTGLPAPTGDGFWIDFVAHEMGHQFGGNHTFNGSTGSCSGNRNASTAWEPGSGSTIMPYAGICGAEDLQPHSDDYFHVGSFDEIVNYSTIGGGNACPVRTFTGNTPPSVDAGPNFNIPARTPFTLTATGSDADGDAITFCWEEFDLGPQSPPNTDDDAARPILRSFLPVTSPSRTFPKLSDILSGTFTFGESLPTRTRTMTFKVTARDNRIAGGGVTNDSMTVSVTGTAGPFVVTSPETPVTWTTGSTRNVTWNVANTASAPISATNVDILLSTDGGLTFPITLAANTPNDGAQTITVPGVTTTTARVKVRAVGKIFFDINNVDFTITPASPRIDPGEAEVIAENCAPGNAAIDPDETVTVELALSNIGTADTTNLVATLLPTGGVLSPSGPQSFGQVIVGGGSVSRAFSFKASGSCGGTITATLNLDDDGSSLGNVDFLLDLGAIDRTSSPFETTLPIVIPPLGPAAPYPSQITVSGVVGTVSKVTATLRGYEHTFPEDVDVLLVGPGGQRVMLMSDAGGSAAVAGVDLTFDDAALSQLPQTQIVSGTYKPTDYAATDNLPAPAPQRPYSSALSVFNGLDPNGTWSLYAADDVFVDQGAINGGGSMTIETSDATCCGFQNPKEASPAGDLLASSGPDTSIAVSYTPACGASDHVVYSGRTPIAGAPAWLSATCGIGSSGTASFDPGFPSPGEGIYFVVVGQNGVEEGSYGRGSSGAERPEATGVGTCNLPQDLTGTGP